MGSTVERIQAYISQREKIRDGGDTITECNGVPLELSDLREAVAKKGVEIEALQAEVREWKRVASAQAELHGTAEDHAQKLAAALQDLLGQLEGVGIYTPGEDAGQWQDAEGVSFTRAESALHEYQAEQATPQHNRGSGSKPGGMK